MKAEPKSIYRIRVRLMGEEELRAVWRIIEIPSHRSLSTLQYAIAASFDNNDDPKWSFFFGRPDQKDVLEYTAEVSDFRFSAKEGQIGPSGAALHIAFQDLSGHLLPVRTFALRVVVAPRGVRCGSAARGGKEISYGKRATRRYSPEGRRRRRDRIRAPNAKAFIAEDITFDELDVTLRGWPGGMKAVEVVGYLQGMLAAPNMVLPSEYLEFVLGAEASGTTTDAMEVIRAILAMNNKLAGLVTRGQPFEVRRTNYADTKEGVLEQIRDLKLEMQGFRRGLDLWKADPDVLNAAGSHALLALIKADALLDSVELTLLQDKEMDAKCVAGYRESLKGMALTLSIVMRDLAGAFRQSVNR